MATNDPNALLRRLCTEKDEGGWLEFKQNNKNPRMIGEWVSACANAAILAGRDRAFLVFGVENGTRKRVGTDVRLNDVKIGGENLVNWLNRLIAPQLMMEFLDFEDEGKRFSILSIEPTYERPVRFEGYEYIRVGENTKRLVEFPEHERALWLATGRRRFEDAIAKTHQSPEAAIAALDLDRFYELAGETKPQATGELLRRLCAEGFLVDDMEGGFDITNLGAILFAKDISQFPSITTKSVRVIRYAGRDKSRSVEREIEGRRGYAVGFEGLLSYIVDRLPQEETYVRGVRRMRPLYPENALREVIANALIHQDFTISGTGPVVEIYSDRVEVTNPGNSLIAVDRIIDERRSRNEKLASCMRRLGICEERGGGLDKAIIAIESVNLPPPQFNSSENSMRVVVPGPKSFNKLTKAEKLRACFFHCVIRWILNDFMSNATLRERFRLPSDDYQAVSAIISESIKLGRIIPADPNQGNRNARYIPYWAREA